MKNEKSCGAVVYRLQGDEIEILTEYMVKGHTSIPKGHVEKKETEEETARREIREETGLKVDLDMNFRHTVTYSPKPDVSKDVVFFVARAKGGKLKEQKSEVVRAVFLPQAEAEEAMTYETDRETIRLACEYIRARMAEAE